MPRENTTWQSVRDEVERRIKDRIWVAGDLLPTEEDLAIELGCARVTVNRALRDLAEQGLLDRRRKAGTKVVEFPTRNVQFKIPILRKEVEEQGAVYGYALLSRQITKPPAPIRAAMQLKDARALHLMSLHLADQRPFVLEDRWINLAAVPQAQNVDFSNVSANAWLVQNAPLSRGELSFGAASLNEEQAGSLGADAGSSVLTNTRLTWNGDVAVTFVTLTYTPGHRIRTAF